MASMHHLRGVGIIEIIEIVLVLLAAQVCDKSVEREQLDDHLRRYGLCGVTLARHAAPGSWLAQLQLSDLRGFRSPREVSQVVSSAP